jgi:transposase InsO family protein
MTPLLGTYCHYSCNSAILQYIYLKSALIESFYSSFKRELDLLSCVTREQVEMEIFQFIEIDYNRKLLHSSLGYMTLEE